MMDDKLTFFQRIFNVTAEVADKHPDLKPITDLVAQLFLIWHSENKVPEEFLDKTKFISEISKQLKDTLISDMSKEITTKVTDNVVKAVNQRIFTFVGFVIFSFIGTLIAQNAGKLIRFGG